MVVVFHDMVVIYRMARVVSTIFSKVSQTGNSNSSVSDGKV